jgi:hypothetical protein
MLVDGAYHKSIVRRSEVSYDFMKNGRYNATYNEGHHILTLVQVNVTEAGGYNCFADGSFCKTANPVWKIVLEVYGWRTGSFSKVIL